MSKREVELAPVESEQLSKRARKTTDADGDSTNDNENRASSDEVNSTSSEKHSNEELEKDNEGKVKDQEVTVQKDRVCVICMEGASERKTIVDHQCTGCKKGAWHVCVDCEVSLLSKACVVCRGDYAPKIYYWYPPDPPDQALREANDVSEAARKQLELYIKGSVFTKLSLFTSEAVAVWCPHEHLLHFSLPQNINLPPQEIRYIKATLPISNLADIRSVPSTWESEGRQWGSEEEKDTEVVGDAFHFTNSVWDALEAYSEGATGAGGTETEVGGATRAGSGTYAEDARVMADQEEVRNSEASLSRSEGQDSLLGRHIIKAFEDGDYTGEVVSYDNPYYKILYSDGDEEEMSESEIRAHLVESREGMVPLNAVSDVSEQNDATNNVQASVASEVPPQEVLDIRGVLRWIMGLLSDPAAEARLMCQFTPREVRAMIADEMQTR